MAIHTVRFEGKKWVPVVSKKHIVNGKPLINYKGTKGYNLRWGKYIDVLCPMLEYLRYQNKFAYDKYEKVVKYHNKPSSTKLTEEEINSLVLEVWKLLDYDTQRKFEHHIWCLDKNFKRYYNYG